MHNSHLAFKAPAYGRNDAFEPSFVSSSATMSSSIERMEEKLKGYKSIFTPAQLEAARLLAPEYEFYGADVKEPNYAAD